METTGTVYIVDDDDAVRDSLEALMESVGFRSRIFTSGDHFLAADPPPDSGTILLDLNMPGKSGMDVLKILSAEPNGNPVIVITGQARANTEAKCIKAGAIAVLRKPLQKKLLLETIRRAS